MRHLNCPSLKDMDSFFSQLASVNSLLKTLNSLRSTLNFKEMWYQTLDLRQGFGHG